MRVAAPVAHIDLRALRHNLAVVRQIAAQCPVMAVVKADAYGHDLATLAPALASADALAVARVEEGAGARGFGLGNRILVLEGASDTASLAVAARHELELVVHHASQIDLLEAYADESRLRVWLKIDTGMSRLGFSPADFPDALSRLESLRAVAAPVHLMTHLASADLRDDPMTGEQIRVFVEATSGRAGEPSIANSAGLLAWPASRVGWVRPGIMLYGISPFAGGVGADFGLRPVMHFETRLIATRRIRAGATVGYCGTWTASRDTWIGTAAVGYGDGYPGNLPADTPVQVHGGRLPLAGRVSMDMITIDLGPEPAARVGDAVTLWGPGLPVEEIAALAGRLSYELVCGVSKRVPRVAGND